MHKRQFALALILASVFGVVLFSGCVAPQIGYCGNGVCDGNETSLTCPADCGLTPGGSGGGNGGVITPAKGERTTTAGTGALIGVESGLNFKYGVGDAVAPKAGVDSSALKGAASASSLNASVSFSQITDGVVRGEYRDRDGNVWYNVDWYSKAMPGENSSSDLPVGLAAYYPFDNNFLDESGNGNDANIYGGGVVSIDRLSTGNKVADFNLSGCLEVAHSPSLQLGPMSVSVWMKPIKEGIYLPSPRDQRVFLYKGGIIKPQTIYSYYYGMVGNGSNWSIGGFYNDLNANSYPLGGSRVPWGLPADGNWHQYISTRDANGNYAAYIDGVLMQTAPCCTKPPNYYMGDGPLMIGCKTSGTTNYQGGLDELRIYNNAITSGEAAALYASEAGKFYTSIGSSWVQQKDITGFDANAGTKLPEAPDTYTNNFKLQAGGTGYKAGDYLTIKAGGVLGTDTTMFVLGVDANGQITAYVTYGDDSRIFSNQKAQGNNTLQLEPAATPMPKRLSFAGENAIPNDGYGSDCVGPDGLPTTTPADPATQCQLTTDERMQRDFHGCWVNFIGVDHPMVPKINSQYEIDAHLSADGPDCATLNLSPYNLTRGSVDYSNTATTGLAYNIDYSSYPSIPLIGDETTAATAAGAAKSGSKAAFATGEPDSADSQYLTVHITNALQEGAVSTDSDNPTQIAYLYLADGAGQSYVNWELIIGIPEEEACLAGGYDYDYASEPCDNQSDSLTDQPTIDYMNEPLNFTDASSYDPGFGNTDDYDLGVMEGINQEISKKIITDAYIEIQGYEDEVAAGEIRLGLTAPASNAGGKANSKASFANPPTLPSFPDPPLVIPDLSPGIYSSLNVFEASINAVNQPVLVGRGLIEKDLTEFLVKMRAKFGAVWDQYANLYTKLLEARAITENAKYAYENAKSFPGASEEALLQAYKDAIEKQRYALDVFYKYRGNVAQALYSYEYAEAKLAAVDDAAAVKIGGPAKKVTTKSGERTVKRGIQIGRGTMMGKMRTAGKLAGIALAVSAFEARSAEEYQQAVIEQSGAMARDVALMKLAPTLFKKVGGTFTDMISPPELLAGEQEALDQMRAADVANAQMETALKEFFIQKYGSVRAGYNAWDIENAQDMAAKLEAYRNMLSATPNPATTPILTTVGESHDPGNALQKYNQADATMWMVDHGYNPNP